MPGLVQIGCTDAEDAGTRIAQLYTTGVPLPFEIEFAARVDDHLGVERALHTAFAPNRVNPRREFFRLDPEQPIAILRLLHVQDATTEVTRVTEAATDEQSRAAAEQQKSRRPRLNFEEMGIPIGAVLRAVRGDAFVTVTGPRRVRLGEDDMSLTAATQQVLGNDYAVAPGPHWTYEGRVLRDIYDETYPGIS
jgi:hypothetical protein